MRACLSLTVTAFALAGSIGVAAAQYYPPPPPGYEAYPEPQPGYPPPPPGYYPQPSYSSAPLPPPGAAPGQNGGPYGYGAPPPGYGAPPPVQQQSEAYPPQSRPYGAPDDRFPPQPLPAQGGLDLRPPGEIGSAAAPADVTGSVQQPAANPPPPANAAVIAALPPEDQPERGPHKELPPQFRRQLVDYVTTEPPGTLIVDTPHTYLYLVMGHGKAMRYGIGVGREGFTWTGTERISRMKEWPDWFPPKEMIERQPYLPRFMAGGESNPLGARALYLGNTLYRIHGTNQPSTIGSFVSSGCIRLTNDDIADLYTRVQVGTRVVVLPGAAPASTASAQGAVAAQQGPISH